MSVSAATLRLLMAAGLSGEQMLAIVESMEADIAETQPAVDEAAERRRARDRQRKRDIRSISAECPQTFRGHDIAPPDKERSPIPPKEINPLPSLRSVHTARETEEAQFSEFWLAYPNKVGKPKARASFAKAMKRDEFEVIMDGLRRYIRTRPPDRDWLNPATFLNQERWNDEPATVTQRSAFAAPSRQQAVIDGVAAAVERRERIGGWEAQADAWRRGVSRTDAPDRGFDFELSPEPQSGTG